MPSGTPDGDYQVTFHLHTATGTALPDVVEDIGVAQPGDMAPYYNDTGISSDTDQGAANFDGDGFSYSEQALAKQGVTLGGAVTADGVEVRVPVGSGRHARQRHRRRPDDQGPSPCQRGDHDRLPGLGDQRAVERAADDPLHGRQQPDGDARLFSATGR